MRLPAVALSFLLLAGPAHAEEPTRPRPTPALGLTISGGVSLGAFEAGYLYYLTLFYKLNPGLVDPRIYTGASAGGANAVLSLMSACRPPELSADDNLFFNAWVPIGINQLFDRKKASPLGAFNREPLQRAIERIQGEWNKGLDPRCDAVLGIAATRITASQIALADGRVNLPRTEAKFVFRVRGQGPGKPPLLTNYVNPLNPVGRPLLPVDDGNISFEALGQVLQASAAFPLAFPPQAVTHCPTPALLPPAADPNLPPPCTRSSAITSLFVDGGVFDNQPLRLAVQMAARGLLRSEKGYTFEPVPVADRSAIPPEATFLYVDPDTEVLPEFTEKSRPPLDSAVPFAGYLVGQLVESARTKELQSLLEESPHIKPQIGATLTYFKPLSGALRNFFGFFDTDIRVHDFSLGMHSARRYLEEVAVPWAGEHKAPFVWPEAYVLGSGEANVSSWQPLRCMRAVFDGVGDVRVCDAVPMNLRVGIQAVLDKLYARCARVFDEAMARGESAPGTAHRHCQAAMAGKAPPQVPGVEGDGQWRFKDADEGEFDHELRRLVRYGFVFNDLGLKPSESGLVRRRIAKTFVEAAGALARTSRDVDLLVPTVGRAYAQSISYAPPDHALHATVGTRLEVGYSFTRGEQRANWLRLHLAVALEGITTAFTTDRNRYLMLTPMLGPEFELVPLSSPFFQWRLGARVGFQFSTADRFASVGCDDRLPCTRLSTEAYLSSTLLQWVRLQVGVSVLPPLRGLALDVVFRPAVGAELDWP